MPAQLPYHTYPPICQVGARKFRITAGNQAAVPEEAALEEVCHQLADRVAPLHRLLAPDSYNNMALFEEAAWDCRLGRQPGRPYSGITTVVDFCAHSHRDTTNMVGGCTAIVTLTKPENRIAGVPADEQFHTLPMYAPDAEGAELAEAEASGGLTVLRSFNKKVVLGQKGPKECKKRTPKRKASPVTSVDPGVTPQKQGHNFADAVASSVAAVLRQQNPFFAQQQLAFPNADGESGVALGYPAGVPPWFLSPVKQSELPLSREGEDSGHGADTQRLANIQIYESDCQEAFRYVPFYGTGK